MTDSTAEPLDWSGLYRFRRATQKRYKTIWALPIKKRHHQLVSERLADIDSILELGAGSRNFYDLMRKKKQNLHYKSFDIDRTHAHDFHRLEDIAGEYDAVCMFEVIEHVPPELAHKMLRTAFGHLRPGGLLFVTTPNTFHPPEYLRDATHITPWCYDELGAVVQHAGFELEALYRLYQDPLLLKLLRRWIFQPLFRLLGLDFSKQVIAVGRKGA
ncbi:class I SAM-dependent methyltransferase [Gilvimarinus sp. F26214L]|uniref:class I SAM-dependent methyltransferase n=1 Tax=Gilvimarinus sp. DZF01 TaxID=3461371 RepID=UPI00404593E1